MSVGRSSSRGIVGSDSDLASSRTDWESSDGEVLSGSSHDGECGGVSSASDLDSDGGIWDGSILPSDVELLVGHVESSIQVPDSVGGSLVGTSVD